MGVFNETLPADKMLLQNVQAKESLIFSILDEMLA